MDRSVNLIIAGWVIFICGAIVEIVLPIIGKAVETMQLASAAFPQ